LCSRSAIVGGDAALSRGGGSSGDGGTMTSFTQSTMASTKQAAYNDFLFWCGVAFVVYIFGVCMAAAKFSFLGRGYKYEHLDDPEWSQGSDAGAKAGSERVQTFR